MAVSSQAQEGSTLLIAIDQSLESSFVNIHAGSVFHLAVAMTRSNLINGKQLVAMSASTHDA
ncbi:MULTISPECIES: hypothetical protein [unclassified Mycolicibacterium]|uniref:hypothetical protein n=1 Tax=unclassified Mycolicibacterium TaxID=2636767 RepID=UPI002ED85142